ncbi:EamA family transporter [Candidatus Roizmanbacteria bacterium]|nr:EamA family transporter [Candidatus Roizmanbacteria bacterium]
MTWLTLAILTPFLFAITNFLEKFLVEKRIKNALNITILIGFSYGIIGTILLVILHFPVLPLTQLLTLLGIGAILILYLIPYFLALIREDASRIIPLFQVFPAMSLILSYLFLGETITGKQLVGFILVILGGFILGTEKLERGIFKPRISFWLMMLACLLYSVVGVAFKYASANQGFWTPFAYEMMGGAIGSFLLLLYPLHWRKFSHEFIHMSKSTWGIMTANMTFNALADLSYSFAVTLAPVALVSVIGAIQPLFVLVGGIVITRYLPQFIKEDVDKSTLKLKAISIITIFVGIILINL